MDEYVAFFEEYCDFLKTYKDSKNPVDMLSQYNDYMKQYATTMQAFEDLGDEDMTTAEAKLYATTNLEIQKMLLEAM